MSAIAAVVSYFHALAVVQAAGARPPVAYLVPFLADLVILGASAALLDASRCGLPRPRLAMLSLIVGIGVTVAMNVAVSNPHALPAWLIDAWPAVAFVLALESLVGIMRRSADVEEAGPAEDEKLTALYRLFASDGQLLYVGITWDLDGRIRDHRRDKPWWPEVARTESEWFTSRKDAALAEFTAITDEGPQYNKAIRNMGPRVRVAKTVLQAAQDAYADSVRQGEPLSERALAGQFGISRRRAAIIRAQVAHPESVDDAQPAAQMPVAVAQDPPAGVPPEVTTAPAGAEVQATMNGHGSHG